METGRTETITDSHILLLKGEVDLTSSLIIHTSKGSYNIGDELNQFRGDNVKLYIIKENIDIVDET